MPQKALIVGVSKYSPMEVDLQSSVTEREAWTRLLVQRYEFATDDICVLDDSNATRAAILDRFIWLLGRAEAGDQLVFIFCGHGVRARRKDSNGDLFDLQDEALVPLPAGARNALDIAIFDDHLAELYCDMSLPPGVLPTFIFDCCYSAGVDFSDPERVSRVKLPNDGGAVNIARFGLRLAQVPLCTRPLVIAAAGERDLAIEVERERPRSLFSYCAIEALSKNPALSYHELVTSITPTMQFAAQEPTLRGDSDRMQRQFFQ